MVQSLSLVMSVISPDPLHKSHLVDTYGSKVGAESNSAPCTQRVIPRHGVDFEGLDGLDDWYGLDGLNGLDAVDTFV